MKKKLMIYCECQFIRLGLEYAIEHHPELAKNIAIRPCSVLKTTLSGARETPDIAILVLDQHVGRWLTQQNNEEATLWDDKVNVVLIKPREGFEGMTNYLHEIMNVRAVLETNVALIILQGLLLSIVKNPVASERDRRRQVALSLSVREKTVINRLLRGERPVQIATELRLSDKTVSNHKIKALKKLRARSLRILLLGG